VVQKELGFGEGQLLHKLCKVTSALSSNMTTSMHIYSS
jgi:hypothetical protein